MGHIRKVIRGIISQRATNLHRDLFPSQNLDYRSLWEGRQHKRVDANEIIFSALSTTKPFLAARFGNTELEIAQQWRRVRKSKSSRLSNFIEAFATGDPHFVYFRSKDRLKKLGINPLGSPERDRFGELMAASMEEIDLLGSWVPGEMMFMDLLHGATVDELKNLEPYRHERPWSLALRGQRVLVVHPFAHSIQKQFAEHRKELFALKNVLPDFELVTFVPPRAHHGELETATAWFSALEEMCKQTLDIDFDVAIVGAGPFGLPLAAEMKRSGRKVVHLGGLTQLLFGIMGARWESDPLVSSLRNEYWTRPSEAETPPLEARRVSSNSYW